jgi:hypothetical protein
MTRKNHGLRIVSLHDAQAECACGGWHYSGVGKFSREHVEAEWDRHVAGCAAPMRPKNVERARRGEHALKHYTRAKGEAWNPGCESETALTDLLADLMHYCRWKHLAEFEVCHARAGNHFTEETEGRDDE